MIVDEKIFAILQDSSNSGVELKVLLPDRRVSTVTIRRNDTADQVYEVSLTK